VLPALALPFSAAEMKKLYLPLYDRIPNLYFTNRLLFDNLLPSIVTSNR
jgi:hypothetical protein